MKTTLRYMIPAGLLCLILGSWLTMMVMNNQHPTIVHIETNRVFSEFVLTKELEAKLSNTLQSRENILKDLELKVEAMKACSANSDSILMSQEELAVKLQQFDQASIDETQRSNEQIWTQLNQYIQDFCADEGYNYLLGANGNGSLMAASDGLDVTEDVIAYVNQKYQGL